MSQKVTVRVSGLDIERSPEEVRGKLATQKAQEPEPIQKVWVKAGHRKYPIKQALRIVEPRLLASGFTTADAIRAFMKFGLHVGENKE